MRSCANFRSIVILPSPQRPLAEKHRARPNPKKCICRSSPENVRSQTEASGGRSRVFYPRVRASAVAFPGESSLENDRLREREGGRGTMRSESPVKMCGYARVLKFPPSRGLALIGSYFLSDVYRRWRTRSRRACICMHRDVASLGNS